MQGTTKVCVESGYWQERTAHQAHATHASPRAFNDGFAYLTLGERTTSKCMHEIGAHECIIYSMVRRYRRISICRYRAKALMHKTFTITKTRLHYFVERTSQISPMSLTLFFGYATGLESSSSGKDAPRCRAGP